MLGRRGAAKVGSSADRVGPFVNKVRRRRGLDGRRRGRDGSAAKYGAGRQRDGRFAREEHLGRGGLVPALLLGGWTGGDVVVVPLVLGQRARVEVFT